VLCARVPQGKHFCRDVAVAPSWDRFPRALLGASAWSARLHTTLQACLTAPDGRLPLPQIWGPSLHPGDHRRLAAAFPPGRLAGYELAMAGLAD